MPEDTNKDLTSHIKFFDYKEKLEVHSALKWLSNFKGFISVTHISNGMPISITKISTTDNKQERNRYRKIKRKKIY